MTMEEGFFRAGAGEELFYRFQPGREKKNPILLLHGHGEHSGRYLKFFSQLENLGHPVAIFDLRGCGRSGGNPVYVSSFQDYLKDVSTFLDFLRLRYQIALPLHLFGHSLGGLIATAWASENNQAISKMILSSPLFGIPMRSVLKVLVNFLDRFVPRLVIRNPVRPFYLTHDPEEMEKYCKDPLIRRRITIRLVHEMLKWSSFFQEKGVSFPFPVYILMAEQEYVVDSVATMQFFNRLEAPAKEIETFPGFLHEIFNERGQEKVFERLRYYLTL